MATMQFAMGHIVAHFLVRYPKVNVVAHATDQNVDIRRRELRCRDQSPYGPTPRFDPGPTDADASAMVPDRGLGVSMQTQHRKRPKIFEATLRYS
jgi:hypothetical protein